MSYPHDKDCRQIDEAIRHELNRKRRTWEIQPSCCRTQAERKATASRPEIEVAESLSGDEVRLILTWRTIGEEEGLRGTHLVNGCLTMISLTLSRSARALSLSVGGRPYIAKAALCVAPYFGWREGEGESVRVCLVVPVGFTSSILLLSLSLARLPVCYIHIHFRMCRFHAEQIVKNTKTRILHAGHDGLNKYTHTLTHVEIQAHTLSINMRIDI